MKPREFYITLKEDGSPTHIALFKKFDDLDQLTVIDKSAYDKAVEALKRQLGRPSYAEIQKNIREKLKELGEL